ncbi:hypothetical protein CK203_095886 [Vitis vinifera]|uniref:Uncharacterized protein n=1 Tax=Vitis vinifera TaxID=29760 RepID=A0A438C7R4_VITVI|nr:hypothetical protein CK203_095886 [Vitis vinifera]
MEKRGERDCKENVEGRFPLTFWEVTGASAVVGAFVLGLACVYLTMPASDYSFLKLPRSLEDIQILRSSIANLAVLVGLLTNGFLCNGI